MRTLRNGGKPCREIFAVALIVLLFCGEAWSASPGKAAPGRRLALVIGNAAYKNTALRNAVNDARAMAGALEKLGFEVILRENLSRRETLRALGQFSEQLWGGEAGLFYYAGHGLQVKGTNYLVPVDAEIAGPADVAAEAVELDLILDKIGESEGRANLVIIDACRADPFGGRVRSLSRGLAPTNAPKGTIVAYATAPGFTASDGDGENGVYTAELVRALEQPGLRVEDVFKLVRQRVAGVTGQAQIPWESTSLTGDFFFRPGPRDGGDAGKPVADDTAELAFWEAIKSSAVSADYRAYLETFPNGRFAALARVRAAGGPAGGAPAPSTRETESASGAEPVDLPMVAAVSGAKLRAEPSPDSRELRSFEPGARLHAVGRSRDGAWYKADEPGGERGWIFAETLRPAADATPTAGASLSAPKIALPIAELLRPKNDEVRDAAPKPGRQLLTRALPGAAEPGAVFESARAAFERGEHARALAEAKRAAGAGDQRAAVLAGWIVQNGMGLPADPVQAASWYRSAAERGYAPAQYLLGALSLQGLGVAPDLVQAIQWYRLAADQGYDSAQAALALMYRKGWGVPQDYAQALFWYRRAADQGNAEAAVEIGAMHQNGWGVAQDYAEALQWYRRAVDRGSPEGAYALGFLYENGRGVDKAVETARDWYRRAAALGSADAAKALDRLGS